MRRKAVITSGIAATVLGGGLVLALNGGGSASAAGTTARTATQTRPSASSSPSVATTVISRSQAEGIALKAVPGGQVRSAELEDEHGVVVWSVDVIKDGLEHELDIDARTGEIVDHDRDDEARDRDDDGARDRDDDDRHDDDALEGGHRHGGGDDDHGGDRHGGGHRGRG